MAVDFAPVRVILIDDHRHVHQAAATISRSTVKFHINNIVQKMGVETRVEAIVLAAKNNLV